MTTSAVQLDDVCERIDYGFTASADFAIQAPKLLRITDIQEGSVNWRTMPGCKINPKEESANALQPGDIVIARTGATTGKAFLIKHAPRSVFASYLIRLRTKPNVIPGYVFGFLQSGGYWNQINRAVRGAAQGGVNATTLGELQMTLPPLPTQRRIAAQLEQADRLRRTRRHALELSDDFLPAIFRKLFGDPQTESRWPVVPFGELISSGPQNGLYKPSTSYGTGTRIVRIDAYQNGGAIDLSALKRLQVSDEEIATYGLKPGDFLINRVNSRSHLGKSTRITQMPEPMVFESNMMRFRVDETRLDSAFALHQLQTPFINRQIQKQAKDASNQSSINQDDVEGFGIMLPPLTQQQHFARLVTRHQRLRAIQQESLRQAEHLFQTLLKRAFG